MTWKVTNGKIIIKKNVLTLENNTFSYDAPSQCHIVHVCVCVSVFVSAHTKPFGALHLAHRTIRKCLCMCVYRKWECACASARFILNFIPYKLYIFLLCCIFFSFIHSFRLFKCKFFNFSYFSTLLVYDLALVYVLFAIRMCRFVVVNTTFFSDVRLFQIVPSISEWYTVVSLESKLFFGPVRFRFHLFLSFDRVWRALSYTLFSVFSFVRRNCALIAVFSDKFCSYNFNCSATAHSVRI